MKELNLDMDRLWQLLTVWGSGGKADKEAALWGADHCLDFLKVIKVTGFMKGLYTDAEMKSDNVKVGWGGGRPSASQVGFL